MKKYVLKTHGVCKRYGDQYAVDHVDMEVKQGEIYGFIGRNGAGKTTLIRMITGLAHLSGGSIELFGCKDEAGLRKARSRMGVVVEYPALYPNMTAEQNLEHHRLLTGIQERACIGKILELVGLSGTGNKKVKNFSLGMKQRLGLAMALLNDPEFIILDEPTNGLDPAGIVEMRETLKSLVAGRKITILISSHILAELAQLATCYGIIHEGRLIRQLSSEQLLEECRQSLLIKVDDSQKAVSIIEKNFHPSRLEVMPENEIRLFDCLDRPDDVNAALVRNGLRVKALSPAGQDLEGYFMRLTGGVRNA